jgi:insertion element IS1 protein InsB
MDYMWSFVESKKQERWLWHAIDHQTGQLLAYVLAPHHDAAFKQLQSLRSLRLAFNISIPTVGARMSVISTHNNIPLGIANTQTIERKHLTMRTRIKRLTRKTICFSKSIDLHDIVIGLFINRHEFGRAI